MLSRIYWLLNNTCNHLESLQPLFYAQGVDFVSNFIITYLVPLQARAFIDRRTPVLRNKI